MEGTQAGESNVLICGPTGVGKSYIACALAHAACRQDLPVRYLRLPRLVDEFAKAEALQKKSGFFRSLAKAKLLVIDDFGLAPLGDQIERDLLEVLDDRHGKSATIVTSQLPVSKWHAYVSIRYTERLAEAGLEPSVGTVGDSYEREACPRGTTRWPKESSASSRRR